MSLVFRRSELQLGHKLSDRWALAPEVSGAKAQCQATLMSDLKVGPPKARIYCYGFEIRTAPNCASDFLPGRARSMIRVIEFPKEEAR